MMKKIIFITLLLTLTTSLYGYSKKIILSSFINEKRAEKSLSLFKKSDIYEELLKLQEKQEFKVYSRPSGKYYIVVVEPLLSRELGKKVYQLVKQKYPKAYINNYTPVVVVEQNKSVDKVVESKPVSQPTSKPIQTSTASPIEPDVREPMVLEPLVEEPGFEKNTSKVKVTKVQKNLETVVEKEPKNIEPKDETTFDLLDTLLYVVLAIIFSVLVYYFIKFKRIYDQY